MCCHLKGRCLRYCVLDIRKESHTGEVQAALWLRWLIGHFFERSTLQICVYFTSRTSFRHFLQIGLKRNLQLPCLLFFLLIAHISEVIIFSRESSYQSFLIDCLKRLNAHFLCQAGPKSILGSSVYFLPHILTPSQTILAPVVLIPDHWCPSSLCLQAGILSELCIHWTCCLSEMFTWSLEPQLSRSPTEFVISFLLCTDFFHFAIVGGHPAAVQKSEVTPTTIALFPPNSSQICLFLFPSPSLSAIHHHFLPRQLQRPQFVILCPVSHLLKSPSTCSNNDFSKVQSWAYDSFNGTS